MPSNCSLRCSRTKKIKCLLLFMRQLPFFPRFVFSDRALTRGGHMSHITLGPTPDSIPHSSKIGKKAGSLAWRLDGSLNSKVCHLLSLSPLR